MKMKFKFASLLAILALSLFTLAVRAQGPGGPGPDPDPSPGIPFDGGLSLVVIAGVAYAAKKGFDKKKKERGGEQVEK